jgi:hypothetical protein
MELIVIERLVRIKASTFGVLLLGAGAYYLVSGFLQLQAGPGNITRKRKRKRISA